MQRKLSNLFLKIKNFRKKKDTDKKKKDGGGESTSTFTEPEYLMNQLLELDNDTQTVYKYMKELDEYFHSKKKSGFQLISGELPYEYVVIIQIVCMLCYELKFCLETVHYTMDILKRFTNTTKSVNLPTEKFFLTLITSFLISSKYEEVEPLFINEIVEQFEGYNYFAELFDKNTARAIRYCITKERITLMEIEVLEKLRYQPVVRSSVLWFVNEYYYTQKLLGNKEHRVCIFLMESLLFNFDINIHNNESIAEASICMTKKMFKNSKVGKCNEKCYKALAEGVKRFVKHNYNKHRCSIFFQKEKKYVLKHIGQI